jgi:ribosome-binding protein aMBF1 (putative translation factor)
MKLSDLKTLDEVVEEHRADPDFRAEWDRLEFARAVAARIVGHRSERGLSQRALATSAGMTQPQVARLEKAEHQPSFETLARLSRATGLHFRFEVADGVVEFISA